MGNKKQHKNSLYMVNDFEKFNSGVLILGSFCVCLLLNKIIRDQMSGEISIFLKQIQHYSYAGKYRRWEEYLEAESQSDNYLYFLGIFLESFPFNYRYWLEYIQLTKFEEYQTALLKNPKSYDLWITYLHDCRLMYCEKDQQKYKKELEKAIIEIGADTRSLSLYQEYYEMVSESFRFQFYKKLFTRALVGLQSMYQKFESWYQMLSQTQINQLAIKQLKALASSLTIEQQKQQMKDSISEAYKKTISYREKRIKMQERIKHFYFDGSQFIQKQKEYWRELLKLERDHAVFQNRSYCYERMLMAQTNDIQLWQQAFHFMEHEANKYTKVLSILRNNKYFFIKFDVGLYFYWCDLQQRENQSVARKMYDEISKINKNYQIYERWIQFEIRCKEWNNAKAIYDNLVIIFQSDIEMLCYILVQYSDFVVKYFKDFDYSKKLLKAYFDHLPFNHFLFTKYLDFLKNFENKEGFYEELMQFINEAIVKSHKTLNDQQFTTLIKTIKFYLRSSLGSIYLVKLSEHRIFEIQEKLAKIA